MGVIIVTSGIVAGKIMRRLVDGHPRLCERGIWIQADDSRGEASSTAANILARRRGPVAVVADADSLSPHMIAEQRGWIEYLLGEAAPPSEWRILLIAPEVAVLLFRDEQLLRSLLPVSPSFEQLIRGRYEPNRVLAELFAQAGEQPFPESLVRRIEQAELSSLWAAPELRPLEAFLLEKLAAQQPGTVP
ncbi:hypothetical protein F0U60_38435 [Archangium minus]|uniref:Uncharacterized protein n=1 Tax=Archangium minus TaxID=83450 RepID=A0ABY9X1Y1_9BACT|nr:hypothetical protein F0U61_38080 [Archangium violaceum]WNG49349.1 hypothetical protein F0U60_38435 [Archangium minus]